MPNFDILRTSSLDKTFRVSKVASDFDLNVEESSERFKGDIKLPETWGIGCIVGNSGTGKSTIAKELFGEHLITGFEYNKKSVIDDMPNMGMDEIYKLFYAVGFGSVPSWLKPYHVLSNGEKMRVDLARALAERDTVVFDEFTSVVDRDVAKTACIAINKTIKRKPDKKFIAVACHHDIIEYLQPDWVFDTNKMQMLFLSRLGQEGHLKSVDVTEANGKNLAAITI